jgi:hypothetical protein
MSANLHFGLVGFFSKRLARLDKRRPALVNSFRVTGGREWEQHQGSGPSWHGAGSPPKDQFRAVHRGFHVRDLMPDFSVTVDRQSIVVSKPSAGLLVTYHKQGRVLVAPELWRIKPSAEELNFYVRAWKAACAEARSLGWIA